MKRWVFALPWATLVWLLYVLSSPCSPPPYYFTRGYVLSVNEARMRRMHTLLHSLHIQPIHLKPVPLTDPQIVQHSTYNPRIYSQLLTSVRFWNDHCAKDQGWVLLFEDDCALHPSVTQVRGLLQEAFRTHRDVGFFYMGLCGPTFLREGQGYGSCAHAYALYCPKAQTLMKQLPIRDDFWILDVQLRDGWRRLGGVPILGWNLTSPQASDHVGLFFQDRQALPPENW